MWKPAVPVHSYFFAPSPTAGWLLGPVSSEISDFTPCAHAQSGISHIKYAEKTDDKGSGLSVLESVSG